MQENRHQDLLREIVKRPENDHLRLEYSKLIAATDPALATFIDLQIERASQSRRSGSFKPVTVAEEALLEQHAKLWVSKISNFVRRADFHRGFIERIVVRPRDFLAHGNHLLAQAPVRHVAFVPTTDELFPLGEILSSPLISGMDSVAFSNLHLTDEQVKEIAGSRSMGGCLWLGLKANLVTHVGFRALAASPNMRNLLYIERGNGISPEYHPGQRLEQVYVEDSLASPTYEWAPLGEDGKALEREFGYLPWLHPQDNACDKFDARWFVEQGILPKRPAGSPVD
jgi:hypothetical protein